MPQCLRPRISIVDARSESRATASRFDTNSAADERACSSRWCDTISRLSALLRSQPRPLCVPVLPERANEFEQLGSMILPGAGSTATRGGADFA